MKKKILVDLDVTTLAFWDEKDEANLIEKVKGGIFFMVTPYIIPEHLSKWKHRKLAEEITNFYEKYSSQIVTIKNILDKIDDIGIEYEKLLFELIDNGVKEEDAILVIVSGIFDVVYLITFNRKHLKSKEKAINQILGKNGLKTIRIIEPSEL